MLDSILKHIGKWLPRYEVKDGWFIKHSGDMIEMSQQFGLSIQSSRVTANREIALPYEIQEGYSIQMTPNSRVEADVFNYGAQRTSTTRITIHAFSTSTAYKYFFVKVSGLKKS